MIIDKTIKFLLHKRNPGETKNLGIRMRVTIKGQTPMDFPFPKTLKIDADDWDFDTMRPKSGVNTTVATDINRTIGDWVGKIGDVFARFEIIEMRVPANDEVKALFNDYIGKKSILDASNAPKFFDVFDMFTETMGKKNEWTAGTHEKFHALRNHLEAFDKGLPLPRSMKPRRNCSCPICTGGDSATPPSKARCHSSNGSCGGLPKTGSIMGMHTKYSSHG